MESCPIVIDNGSQTIKAGFGGDSDPSLVYPTGTFKTHPVQPPSSPRGPPSGGFPAHSSVRRQFSGFVGVMRQFSSLLKSPIENRVVTNLDGMESIWSEIFADGLKIDPSQHPFLITESVHSQLSMRQSIAQIFFEKFRVPSFYSAFPTTLSLYNSEVVSGIAVDAGESIIDVVPIYNSYSIQRSSSAFDFAGRHIVDNLKKLLNQKGVALPYAQEREILRGMKEQICFVKGVNDAPAEEAFLCPDGTKITVSDERYLCAEPIFQPQSPGQNSLQSLITSVMSSCDEDLRADICQKIIISGGTSCLPGFAERLQREVPTAMVVAPANRRTAAWSGGSLFSCLPTFSQLSISKAEYEESGQQIVGIKFF